MRREEVVKVKGSFLLNTNVNKDVLVKNQQTFENNFSISVLYVFTMGQNIGLKLFTSLS